MYVHARTRTEMGRAEEERGAGSEAFTDSADGSSSSSDAASTDGYWPAVVAPASKKTPACRVPDAELDGKQQKRRATTGNCWHQRVLLVCVVFFSSLVSGEVCTNSECHVCGRDGDDEGEVREAAARQIGRAHV